MALVAAVWDSIHTLVHSLIPSIPAVHYKSVIYIKAGLAGQFECYILDNNFQHPV